MADRFFEDDDINKIALVAPEAKLNIIKDYKVVEKRIVSLPDEITGYVRCFNPKCITNHEDITPRFSVVGRAPLELKCHYCEKVTSEEHMEIK